jgi:hypothetical protein
MAKKTSDRVRSAVKAYVESQEREQTPEEKRENAWFPIHIKSVMENKGNICYENGLKTGESLMKAFGFEFSDAWHFAEGLKLFYAGVVNAIERMEAEPKPEQTPSKQTE